MKCRDKKCSRGGASRAAFTLMEVMIAVAIFFMAMFTILGVLSSALRGASMLRSNGPTAGMRASELTLTNKLEEGSDSGTFGDIPIYDGYRWTSETREVATNGLFQVDFAVYNPKGDLDSTLSVLFYRPDSQSSHLGLQ
jgi:Tfp pilus assembly protein PilV